MVSNTGIIEVVAERLRKYGAKNVVVDPVMVSTSGSKLISDDACGALVSELFPLAALVTPNALEGERLCGFPIENEDDMLRAAKAINGANACAVLVKGGHNNREANDVLYDSGAARWFHGKRIANPNTHGTGCTLSSAIACRLAEGKSLGDSVLFAKEYLTGAIEVMMDLGIGAGPIDHMYK